MKNTRTDVSGGRYYKEPASENPNNSEVFLVQSADFFRPGVQRSSFDSLVDQVKLMTARTWAQIQDFLKAKRSNKSNCETYPSR